MALMNRIHHYDATLLGDAIERARKHRGLSRAQLGRNAGSSKAVVGNHENGTTKAYVFHLVEVANALRINSMLLAAACVHEAQLLRKRERCMVVLHPDYWPVRYGEVRECLRGGKNQELRYRVRIYGAAASVYLDAKYIRRLP